jgi:Tfp pilus assembly protein PilO
VQAAEVPNTPLQGHITEYVPLLGGIGYGEVEFLGIDRLEVNPPLLGGVNEFLLFRPSPEVNREFYAEIPVEIRVKGTYNEVAIFFDKVGKLPRIVNISGVSMEGAKEVLGRWEITTACTATTFKFIEKAAVDLAKEKKVEEKQS